MASFMGMGRKSCKTICESDVKENAHLLRAPSSRSHWKSRSVGVRTVRSFSLSSIKFPARSFSSHMQLVTNPESTSDAPDPTNSPPESTLGDDGTDGEPIKCTEENVHVQRAAACCYATYHNVRQATELFKTHVIQRLNFKEVFLSPQPQPDEEDGRQNLLVATAVDGDERSVYVAFRGNSNLADIFSDVSEPADIKLFQQSPVRYGLSPDMGSYHTNFCNRLSDMVPRLDGLLEFCRSLVVSLPETSPEASSQLQQNDHPAADEGDASAGQGRPPPPPPPLRTRLIFCGHSLGGALSHLAAVTYFLSMFGGTNDVLTHKYDDDCLSVTFGAPHVFDSKAAEFLQKDLRVATRFLNFFQAKDPIPFLLGRAPISNQLQEHFQQLKVKNAASLTVAGRSLVVRKVGTSKTRTVLHKRKSQVLSRDSLMMGCRKDDTLDQEKDVANGDDDSVSTHDSVRVVPVHAQAQVATIPKQIDVTGKKKARKGEKVDNDQGFKDPDLVEDLKDVKDATAAPRPPPSGKKSNISKKVSEFGKEVAGYGKEIIRRVTHGGKKAKVKMESQRQMWHLETDIKKARTKPGDDSSAANIFAPVGIYKQLSYPRTSDSHVVTSVKPKKIVDHDFKLKRNTLKINRMASYFNPLVKSHGTETKGGQQSQVSITEGPLPRLDKAELILIRCETSEKLKGARIIAKGSNLSLALEQRCQVTTFSDKWRLVAADCTSIIFETLRATDGKNVYVSQGELIELARVGHGNRATSVSVETMFGRDSGEFCPVLLCDLAADSAVVDGLKHAVGKVLVLLDTDGPKGGEPGRKILQHLAKAADLTGLKESFSVIAQPTKGTVHAKKMMIDRGFIAQLSYALCHKPITLIFEADGARKIQKAAQLVRQHPFTFFANHEAHDQFHIDPFIKSLDLRTKALSSCDHDGQLTIELDSYDQILSCLHALVIPEKHSATPNGGSATASLEHADFIKSYERELFEAIKGLYDGDILRREKMMQSWFSGLSLKSRASLCKRLELLFWLSSAFKVAKEQKLLALIGPENAGKSTLANLLGCKSKEATGFTVHTSDMKSYRLDKDLLAVDFPGTDAPGVRSSLSTIWEAFAQLPDRCIVMTPFGGDVTEGSQELPRLAAQKLCPDVMLLVNRVDGILKGPPKAKIWKQYTKESIHSLHDRFMQLLDTGDVSLKDVLLCCLEDEDLHDSDKAQLKDRGIVFSKEVRKKILEWIKNPSVRGADSAVQSAGAEAVPSAALSVSAEAPRRIEHQVSGHGTDRKPVRPVYYNGIGNSNSLDEPSAQADPECKPARVSHRSNFHKLENGDGLMERANIPKARALASLDERAISTSKPIAALLPQSCKPFHHPRTDQDGASHANRNEIGHSNTSETGTSLMWNRKALLLNNQVCALVSSEHRDHLGQPNASESSTATEESLKSDDWQVLEQGVSADREFPEGQATSSASSTSTSTSTTGLPKSFKHHDGFAHQLSQRATRVTLDQSTCLEPNHTSNSYSNSKTVNQQGSRPRGGSTKKPNGSASSVNPPAWKP
ncbi:hypothetical protein Mapa_005084 [Marchantia paleacea]|nr:hypothetical protein Mapa_005084 [Marchantia paleacea]